MISMSDEAGIETDPGWMEDLTLNVDTCILGKTNHPLITDLLGH